MIFFLRADCNNNGGDLVVVSSLEILYYLKDYNKFNNLKFWIGISDVNNYHRLNFEVAMRLLSLLFFNFSLHLMEIFTGLMKSFEIKNLNQGTISTFGVSNNQC